MIDVWPWIDGAMALIGGLVSARLVLLVVLATVDAVKRRVRPLPETVSAWPSVAAVVPAYNEERVVAGTVRSLLASDVPLTVVVVDDGSRDGTAAVVEGLAAEDDRVRLVRQDPNAGKSAALNAGIAASGCEVVVTVDADTVVASDTVRRLVAPIALGQADAVAGNLKVGNRHKWLGVWQSIEYVRGLNIGRRAQATLGCITTIPGAAAAFRAETVQAVGGFSGDTTTEDTDLTIALLRAGFRVVYAPRARSFTEAPSTWKALYTQRTRWMFGYLQCLWKHRGAFGRPTMLGLYGMPNLLFVHVLVFPLFVVGLPYLARVVEWTTLAGLGGALVSLLWVDVLVAAGAYLVDRERLVELVHVPLQRLVWPFFLLTVFTGVWWRILVRGKVPWTKLERTGQLADAIRDGSEPRVLR